MSQGTKQSFVAMQSYRSISLPTSRSAAVFITVCLLVIPVIVHGQDFRGAVSGHVNDPSAASVPSARVTFLNTASNTPTVAVTDSDGNYAIPYVTAGN